jgi:hypothetical protein
MSTGKKREGKHTWAHNWFCSAHKCLFVSDTGEVCGLIRNARNCVDRAIHLKTHGVTHTTTLPTALGVQNILQALAAACPPLCHEEEVLVTMALNGMANRIVNCPMFRKVTKTAMSRNNVTSTLGALGDKLVAAAVKNFARCTLALDVGTVHNRYLAFVIIARGRALCVRLVSDEDPRVGGHYTIPAVQRVVADVIEELKENKISISALVCDNASNLQGIVKDDLTTALGPRLPLVHRCACHVVQLMVHDCADIWTTAHGMAQEMLKENGISLTSNETRWNSKYRVIARALQIPEKTHSQTRELEDAVTLLEPFATVTDVLQGNKATLFDTLLCMEALTKHFQDLMGKQPNTAYGTAMKRNIEAVTGALLTRMRMLLGRAYLVLA